MKPDVKELLELAKKATPGPWSYGKYGGIYYGDNGPAIGSCTYKDGSHTENGINNEQYITACSPDKMIALLEYVQELEGTINKARIFVDDVMPQIGGICLQDYANMNELCMALTRLEKRND